MRALSRSRRRWPERFLAVAFAAAIAAPGALLVLGRDESADVAFEYRPPAPAPRLDATPASWLAFPGAFERFLGDRFGLRGALLRARARVHWYALGASPTDLMVRGDDGWLFPTSSRAIETSTGRWTLSERELDDWLDAIAVRSAALAERGIVHLVAIAPDKSSAYPERLPPRWAGPLDLRPAARLAARAEERGMRQVLDLLPAVREERRRDRAGDPVYYPLGPHWSARGALAGAAALHARLVELGVALAPLERQRVRFGPPFDPESDSWAGRLYLAGALEQEFLDPRLPPELAATIVHRDGAQRVTVCQRPLPGAASLLVFHDSFGENVVPFLSMTAWRSAWHWRPYDEAALDEYPADAVVELFVERMFSSRLPPSADASRQPRWRAEFARAAPLPAPAGGAPLLRPVGSAGPGDLRAMGDGSVALALRSPAHGFEVELAGLVPGEDHLVRLAFTSPSDGTLFTRYTWRTGPAAYPATSRQRAGFSVTAGDGELFVVMARQRMDDVLLLASEGGPTALVLHDVEARVLSRPAPAALAAGSQPEH